ncbi:tRNA 2-thiouridine synthesizing protein C [Onishia taeanensis]|uniref:tRNA 2-thiouridine synthesizing protein C n=1 Tax=Onishia taeanensis TaxID=284577 RepID=A0A1G7Q8L5_9GAMM|nr:sulfurtransferase complex subunit TusC [Halomonas taeanensis]SDF94798.1 tRNA 2-thiouridine synthesizing protein C [Halomonas taeanensis]
MNETESAIDKGEVEGKVEGKVEGIAKGDLLVILRHSPHGSSWLREGLDAALVAAAFGQQVSLLFAGDGVLALMPHQQAGALGQKGTHGVIDMLAMYDIETLLVDAHALTSRGLSAEDLMLPVSVVEGDALPKLLDRHPLVLNF